MNKRTFVIAVGFEELLYWSLEEVVSFLSCHSLDIYLPLPLPFPLTFSA